MGKVKSVINLESLARGAFAEKLNVAIREVAENIQNPNTDATAKRGVTVNIKFSPDKNRQMVSATISVTTKLAPAESVDTIMIVGRDANNGDIEIAEYDGEIRGQTFIDEATEPAEGNGGITPFRAKA